MQPDRAMVSVYSKARNIRSGHIKFINIKKRRDLTADLKVRIDTGALNDFEI